MITNTYQKFCLLLFQTIWTVNKYFTTFFNNDEHNEFSSVEVWFTDPASKALEIEGNVYSTEPKFRKYVKGYSFLLFARKFSDKYCKKLMGTATKTGIGAAKTASKRVVQKTAEATGDLIGNKITDKITSVGKSKEETKKVEEIYIPPEKRHQIIDYLKLF